MLLRVADGVHQLVEQGSQDAQVPPPDGSLATPGSIVIDAEHETLTRDRVLIPGIFANPRSKVSALLSAWLVFSIPAEACEPTQECNPPADLDPQLPTLRLRTREHTPHQWVDLPKSLPIIIHTRLVAKLSELHSTSPCGHCDAPAGHIAGHATGQEVVEATTLMLAACLACHGAKMATAFLSLAHIANHS